MQTTTVVLPGIVSNLMFAVVSATALVFRYIQTKHLHIHKKGRFKKHAICSLYRILLTAPVSWRVVKLGNIVARVGIEPTSLRFQANVLTITSAGLPDITTPATPTYLYGSLPERSVQTTTLH